MSESVMKLHQPHVRNVHNIVDMLETTILAITTLILIIFSVQDPRLDQMTPMKTELVMGSEGGSRG